MRKSRYLALVFGLMISVSGYSQTSVLEHLLFQGTFNKAFFPNGMLAFSNYSNTTYLNIVAFGVAWEQAIWKGTGYLGIEAGYSSGSRFGGGSSMDFVPIMLNAGYDFPLGDFLSVGPNLKLGGFGLFTPIGDKFVPLIAAHLEGEFRYKPFPLSLYAAGGVDFFPTVSGVLPAIQLGLRFRPFSFNKNSEPKENAASSGQASSLQAGSSQSAAVTPDTASTADNTQSTLVAPSGGGASTASTTQTQTVTPATVAPTGGGTQSTVTPAGGASTASTTQTQTVTPAAVAPTGAGSAASTPPAGAGSGQSGTAAAVAPPAAASQSSRGQAVARGGTPIVINGQRGYLRSVYFQPDTDVLIETYLPELDAVGREMSADSSLSLILRAYTAPAKTPEGRLMVSRERANFCRDYLSRRYNIASSRITSFYYGSESMPVRATEDDWESQRCVELIITE